MKFKELAALILARVMSLSPVAYGGGGGDTASPAPNTGSPSAVTNTPTPKGEVYKIGVPAPEVTHGQSIGVVYYAERRCDELAVEDKIEEKVLISGDATEMTTQSDELKTWGADAIVAFPQWEGVEVPIQQAIDEGITVMNPGIAIGADSVYRVPGDNGNMGKDAAEYIIDKVGTEGTVAVLDMPISGPVAELHKKGLTEAMVVEAPNMVLKGYATKSTREADLAGMADILTVNPQVDTVFSMDDEASIGALQAIRDAGHTDIKVITDGGGCQEWSNMMLADKNQDIQLQPDLYSSVVVEDAVDTALDIPSDSAPKNSIKIIPTERMDHENATDYLDENSPY